MLKILGYFVKHKQDNISIMLRQQGIKRLLL